MGFIRVWRARHIKSCPLFMQVGRRGSADSGQIVNFWVNVASGNRIGGRELDYYVSGAPFSIYHSF